jgi:hypothetical protein
MMTLTQQDRNFLKALHIRADEDLAEWSGVGTTNTGLFMAPSCPGASTHEQAYIEALGDPRSLRDAEGHPKIASTLYGVAHANLRAVAILLRSEAYARGEKCKCGALHPSAHCYL